MATYLPVAAKTVAVIFSGMMIALGARCYQAPAALHREFGLPPSPSFTSVSTEKSGDKTQAATATSKSIIAPHTESWIFICGIRQIAFGAGVIACLYLGDLRGAGVQLMAFGVSAGVDAWVVSREGDKADWSCFRRHASGVLMFGIVGGYLFALGK